MQGLFGREEAGRVVFDGDACENVLSSGRSGVLLHQPAWRIGERTSTFAGVVVLFITSNSFGQVNFY
jgi:hypothetical protein